jgi:hypothetical protein
MTNDFFKDSLKSVKSLSLSVFLNKSFNLNATEDSELSDFH